MSSADLAHAAALHTLYSDHHHWLTGWLRRRLGCPQNAADLAQDTFVKVLVSRQAARICACGSCRARRSCAGCRTGQARHGSGTRASGRGKWRTSACTRAHRRAGPVWHPADAV